MPEIGRGRRRSAVAVRFLAGMCAGYAVHRLIGAPAMTAAGESPLPNANPGSSHAIEIAAALPVPLLPGTNPDVVRDWFDSETIITLPAPAASLAEAEAAAADYRRAA